MTKIINNIKGKFGEGLAVKYLKKLKLKIVCQNYKNKLGEIDIIARDKQVLVFIEVKYREDSIFGVPAEAVNINKQNKIRKVATKYLIENGLFENTNIRFDVVSILNSEINYIKDAF